MIYALLKHQEENDKLLGRGTMQEGSGQIWCIEMPICSNEGSVHFFCKEIVVWIKSLNERLQLSLEILNLIGYRSAYNVIHNLRISVTWPMAASDPMTDAIDGCSSNVVTICDLWSVPSGMWSIVPMCCDKFVSQLLYGSISELWALGAVLVSHHTPYPQTSSPASVWVHAPA